VTEHSATRDLRIFNITTGGALTSEPFVSVDLYGGPSHGCGIARFTYKTLADRQIHINKLEEWMKADAAVTLVISGNYVVIIPDHAYNPESDYTK
jgi:hypothetical protein